MKRLLPAALALLIVGATSAATDQPAPMTFFVTSAGSGNGADLGGLAGADARCAELAKAVGSTGVTWHAYLSAMAVGGQPAVNAKDRIGKGPWHNQAGVLIAKNVAELHGEQVNLTKQTMLTERGDTVNGRGDQPNTHDILTGSQLDGTLTPGSDDTTCRSWTSSGEGSALVGHHDRNGGGTNPTSWNSAHPSRGCSQDNLRASGGNGYFYCFAVN